MTRAELRRLRNSADAVAAILATTQMHRDDAGRLRLLTDPAGVGALRRGFADAIRNDCRPVVRRLTDAEARGLPGWHPTLPGAVWWAAYGFDVEGRASWCSGWFLTTGRDATEAADAAEMKLLADLAAVCNVRGLPAEGAR